MKGRVKRTFNHPHLTSPIKVEEFYETQKLSFEEFF